MTSIWFSFKKRAFFRNTGGLTSVFRAVLSLPVSCSTPWFLIDIKNTQLTVCAVKQERVSVDVAGRSFLGRNGPRIQDTALAYLDFNAKVDFDTNASYPLDYYPDK